MKVLFYILIYCSLLLSQSFVINQDFGQINIDDISYDRPFLGGFNKPKIQWVDWDQDGDDDLFLLDEDGYIKYYDNQISENSQLILISTNYFQELLVLLCFKNLQELNQVKELTYFN